MIEADSVLSTPALNSSSIQDANPRLEGRAESADSLSHQPAIGQPGSRTVAGESGKGAQGLSRRNVLALIDAHRAAEVVHLKVINAQDEAETKYGVRSVEAFEARDRCGAMCDEVNAICWKLAATRPTTLAGVAAVLRFANEVEDAGNEWPDTDTIGADGWHYQLRATMAAALKNIIVAVQS
jgi:hypothetical protein